MSNNVQKIRQGHPTSPLDLHGRRRLDCLPGVQLDDGYPRLPLRIPHVRHRAYRRKDRHRQEMHKVGRFALGDRRCDGVVGNVLCLVHWMITGWYDLQITSI